MKLSALFRCNERKTKSSVRYRRSCLQAEIRSFLYATWHCVVLKINEVWIFDTLRFREFCSAQIICRLQWNTFAWTLLLMQFDWYHIFAALCHGKWIWDWFTSVCIYEENIENVSLGRIMMSGGLDYSRMKDQNLQYVTVAIVCSQRSDPIYIRHGILSYWRRMRYEFLFRCDSAQIICRLQWNIFAWTLLLVEFDWYSIFAALCQTVESEFGIGLLLCVLSRKIKKMLV